jgi:predicted O-linked N-acetylglucosamine transferase (SPINDLY family)
LYKKAAFAAFLFCSEVNIVVQPGRNDLCPCGSGKKYKKCCGAKTAVAVQQSNAAQWLYEARHFYDAADYVRALELFERAARDCPNDAFIQNNIAVVLLNLGRAEEAAHYGRQALKLDPTFADAHNNLARALAVLGQHQEAVTQYRLAIKRSPDNALFKYNLGSLLQSIPGQLDEAERCYQDALRLQPQFSPVLVNLGAIYLEKKNPSKAKPLLLKAHEANPNLPQIMSNLGDASVQLKEYPEAIEWCHRAIALGFVPAYATLGIALENSGDTNGAIEAYRQLIEKDPQSVSGRKNYIRALLAADKIEDAYSWILSRGADLQRLERTLSPLFVHIFQQFANHRALAEAWPIFLSFIKSEEIDAGSLSGALFHLNYDDSLNEQEILELHVKWARLVSVSQGRLQDVPVGNRHASEKIRIGYLSADFCSHSVAYFLRNIVSSHDRQRFHVSCYSNVTRVDDITEFFKRQADRYVEISNLSDVELASHIRADKIDILIDLSGHTRGSRIAALGLRPAPIQISYLGYPNTTGADFVDYWITDVNAHGEADVLHTEKLLRLPESFLCFGEFEDRPIKAEPPALHNGYVTFGSFNNLAKISQTTILIWSQTLLRVPGSQLFIKAASTASPHARTNLRREFERFGVDSKRLVFADYSLSRQDHLDYYNKVDIALDPMPYTGTTTTCEALWMGVPVITLVGAAHRQRTSFSILKNAGLDDLVAKSHNEYVHKAVHLGLDLKSLSSVRQRVATGIRSSILCKPERFTRHYEEILESIWKDHVR